MNLCIFTGRLGRDPEMITTPKDLEITTLSLAVSGRREKQADGSYQDIPTWLVLKAFGKSAKAADKILTKGDLLEARCKASKRTWEADDGTNRSVIEFIVDEWTLIPTGNRPAEVATVEDDDEF